jgi:alpha-1,3-rhamnosyl/mannosyltransferase
MDRYFEPGLKNANAIITDSAFVKRELIEVFGIEPELITAIPLGVEALFVPQTSAQTQSILMQHGLTHGQYFLAVGTLEPRKNLKLALQAFQQLPTSIRQRYPLVLIGIKGWHTAELERQMLPLVQSGEVCQLGYVTRSDLATLIAGATTLVYPSIYEGFGLPPLEAMASGVPVICSNTSSLPEVVGNAGLLIDPNDDTALAQEMRRMVEDSALRSNLANQSILRAREFTWQRCAELTRTVYESVIA